MLWGQKIKVYTDHKNLITDALGTASDRVYRWRILLEEFAPEIVYIKGIHNTVADAISRLDFTPPAQSTRDHNRDCESISQPAASHSAFMQSLCENNDIDIHKVKWRAISKMFNSMEFNFSTRVESVHSDANSFKYEKREHVWLSLYSRGSEEQNEIYPPTVSEISDAQRKDRELRKYFNLGGGKRCTKKYVTAIVDDVEVLVNHNSKMIIPKDLRRKILDWYHHYLQHPGHDRMYATINATMTWKGQQEAVRRYTNKCPQCQKNKKNAKKYGKMPEKLCVTEPWHTLCVDLIGPYTLKGKDKSEIDFMCLTMIDAATRWFEMVELPAVEKIVKLKGQSHLSRDI